jgi:hypothetical protein
MRPLSSCTPATSSASVSTFALRPARQARASPDRALGAVLALHDHADVAALALDLRDRRFEVEAHAFLEHAPVDDVRHVGVLARKDARRDVDDGDIAAQPAERLRHLAADRAAADDDEVRHVLAQVEQRLVGERAGLGEARDRKHRRTRAGRDHERLRGAGAVR